MRVPTYACILGMMLFTSASAESRKEIPEHWKNECVGYFQISIPGDVEVATVSSYDMGVGDWNFSKFSNGKKSVLSSSYYGEKLQVSHKVNEERFFEYRNKVVSEIEKNVRKYEAGLQRSADVTPNGRIVGTTLDDNGGGKRVSISAIYKEGRIFQHGKGYLVSGKPDSAEKNAAYTSFLSGFRPRALFEVPTDSGACFPYGFIKDDGRQPREIGTGMRLIDHPDITITLTDQAPPRTWNRYVKNPTVSEELKYTWGGRQWDNIKGVRILGFPEFPSVTIAGYKGRSSFVEMVRLNDRERNELNDFHDYCTSPNREIYRTAKEIAKCPPETNIVDYGYMAYVKGDKDAKEDTPTLVLNVMQNAADGPDGKPTMTKEEFREMAETIAASIKRR